MQAEKGGEQKERQGRRAQECEGGRHSERRSGKLKNGHLLLQIHRLICPFVPASFVSLSLSSPLSLWIAPSGHAKWWLALLASPLGFGFSA